MKSVMAKKPDPSGVEPNLGGFESRLLGAMLQFHKRFVALVRSSSLDEDGQMAASKRITDLLDEIMAEMKSEAFSPKDFDLDERLDSVYRKAKEIVDELSIGSGKQPEEGGTEEL